MLDFLTGVRVVSFNHFLLGPMGMQILGDLGADVISIENAEGAWQRHWSGGDIWHDGQSVLHLCANRNKRSVAIDLKSAKGRDLALRRLKLFPNIRTWKGFGSYYMLVENKMAYPGA